MTLTQLTQLIGSAATHSFGHEVNPDLIVVSLANDPEHGDYTTNVAMVYAKKLDRSPRELAQELAIEIQQRTKDVKKVEVAGPGFINITLTDQAIAGGAAEATHYHPATYAAKTVVSEYSDPNPFKVLHVGHLYTTIVGDAVSNLMRLAGARVHPVNFGGDVGLHVGKTMWAIRRELGGENPTNLDKIATHERSEWMAKCYVEGTQAYEGDATAKEEIMALNSKIYQIVADLDKDSPLAQIYWKCRGWSYEYFDAFYARLGSKFERYYPESETAPIGIATVRQQLERGVYSNSDGAVVFVGEPYGLHTRVFITSQGLPTYETKDVGVLMAKWADYKFDYSVVITGNDIVDYMKVVLKSVEQFAPELSKRTIHLTHGNVKLAGGTKMSSRKGNFLRAVDVLDLATQANVNANGHDDMRVVLGAVKYSFLKQRIGSDIVFIPEDSVSLEGNSGPYLQYAHARARSILAKAQTIEKGAFTDDFEPHERLLVAKVAEYANILDRAVNDLMPHHICTYLYELAQVFNRFYENCRVLGDEREALRLRLVSMYADVLRNGLGTLGIDAPDHL